MMTAGKATDRNGSTWVPDYRMPPPDPYPAALDDCLTVYRHALTEHPPTKIIVSGVSAGGNLAAALVLRAKDEGLPMPAALVLLTPQLDLTESGDSFQTNHGIDILTPLMPINRLYAHHHDLTHPYLSPLFGDMPGFPPTFLQTGTRDLFLSIRSGCTASSWPPPSRPNSTSSRPCRMAASAETRPKTPNSPRK
jgi:epsilon-lactone hydrolase